MVPEDREYDCDGYTMAVVTYTRRVCLLIHFSDSDISIVPSTVMVVLTHRGGLLSVLRCPHTFTHAANPSLFEIPLSRFLLFRGKMAIPTNKMCGITRILCRAHYVSAAYEVSILLEGHKCDLKDPISESRYDREGREEWGGGGYLGRFRRQNSTHTRR